MKLALVVQRYGREVAGGSEAHCLAIAERLAERHDVTVLTSCAQDYILWRNRFPAGETTENGVRIIRFRAKKRNLNRFRAVSELVFSGDGTAPDEKAWFRENGPLVPKLLEHLAVHGGDFDVVMFWTYRYATSFLGLPLVENRAILLPTAEEDPAIRLGILQRFFRRPAGFLFLTDEEAELVSSRAGGTLPPHEVIGSGLEPAAAKLSHVSFQELGIPEPFVLYLGRVDPNKGCDTMLSYYLRYLEQSDRAVPLVLAGKSIMTIPHHPMIQPLGFVSAGTRQALLDRARFLLMPSRYESLSLVLLESWNHGRPALVNAHCKVLRGQVRRSNAGLHYRNYEEFHAAADLLLERSSTTDRLGSQGLRFVEKNYRWPLVLAKIERLLETVSGS